MQLVTKKFSKGQASKYIRRVMDYFAAYPRRKVVTIKVGKDKIRVRKTHINSDIMRHAHTFIPNRPR